MKFLRYKEGKAECRGILDGNKIKGIDGSIFHEFKFSGYETEYEGAEILPPILPSKILVLTDLENEGTTSLFVKPSTSVSRNKAAIKIPKGEKSLKALGKLGAVISKKCSGVLPEKASAYILGYTAACDTYLNTHYKKSAFPNSYYDEFTPLGPVIETDPSVLGKTVKIKVNGELKIESLIPSQKRMAGLISELSFISTLLPGDVVLAGNDTDHVILTEGNRIEIEIEGLKTLENYAGSKR